MQRPLDLGGTPTFVVWTADPHRGPLLSIIVAADRAAAVAAHMLARRDELPFEVFMDDAAGLRDLGNGILNDLEATRRRLRISIEED